MSTHEFDPFALGSGLPLADTDVVVTAVEFRFDTQYAADACVAAITFQPDQGEAQEQLYSCGKGWEPLDRGASAGHTSGREMNFNGQSNYGRFLAAAMVCEGWVDDARASGRTPHNADLWIGSRFHLGTLEISVTNPTKKDAGATIKTLIIPVEYHGQGEDEDEAAPAKTATKKAAARPAAARPAAAAAKPAVATGGTSAIERKQLALIAELSAENEDLVEELRALAGEHADHESFMEAALELPGVADSELAQQVAMSSKAGSLWATREG